LAGKLLGIKTLIVMPANAPRVKLDATRGYGPKWFFMSVTKPASRSLKNSPRKETRPHPAVRPSARHRRTGTAAKELIEDAGPLDALLVPCGGAGCYRAARSPRGTSRPIAAWWASSRRRR